MVKQYGLPVVRAMQNFSSTSNLLPLSRLNTVRRHWAMSQALLTSLSGTALTVIYIGNFMPIG
uniref:Uncharacterized protein n=1 Tax=Physcomitrium patens TaxID=3218 RepID=A0A2K1IRV7_PHYPA|nr:hypothetical protein PHYPA_026129 [Physcomitrium patens]